MQEMAMAAIEYMQKQEPGKYEVISEPKDTKFVVTVKEKVERVSPQGTRFWYWETIDSFEVDAF